MLASTAMIARVTLGINLSAHMTGAGIVGGALSSPWAIPASFIGAGDMYGELTVEPTTDTYDLAEEMFGAGIMTANLNVFADTGDATASLGGSHSQGTNITVVFNNDDPDGAATGVTYQWIRDAATTIVGATGTSYLLTAADVGHTVKCRVTYVDGLGNSEVIFTPNSVVIDSAPNLTGVFRGQYDIAQTSANPITATTASLGPASADRKIAVVWYAASSTAIPDAMTIQGIAATKLVEVGLTAIHNAIFIANVPTGTTGDIVGTYSGSPNNIATFAVYSITGHSGAVAQLDSTSLFNSSGALSDSINTRADGFVIAHTAYQASATFATTGGFTQDGTRAVSTNKSWYGSIKGTGSPVSFGLPSFTGNKALLAVSLIPA